MTMEHIIHITIGFILYALFQFYRKGANRYSYLKKIDSFRSGVLMAQFMTFYGFLSLFGLLTLFLLLRSVDYQTKFLFVVGLGLALNGLVTASRLHLFKQFIHIEKRYVYALQGVIIGFPLIYYTLYQLEIAEFLSEFESIDGNNRKFLSSISFPRGILSVVFLSVIFYAEGGVLIFQHWMLGQTRSFKDLSFLKNLQRISYVGFINAMFLVFGPLLFDAENGLYLFQWAIILNAIYFFTTIFKNEEFIQFMNYKKPQRKKVKVILCQDVWFSICAMMNKNHPFLKSAFNESDVGEALNIEDENVLKLIKMQSGMNFNAFLFKLRILYLLQKGSSLSSQYQHKEELIKALGFSSVFDFQKEVLVIFGVSYKALLYEPKKFKKHFIKMYPWLNDFNFQVTAATKPSKKITAK